ncbi:VirD4-like conjugal transfer protein, CD1115 family [Paraliobacillus ryukyuensis]|uniref:VirD4-like conjugal transfer protein, CD1115 family n=1 Tax=Paraliobacillus ryukyuensis TaxID=200904 RepID=UPI0009A7FA88|nr:type IV secretory system conjugative DNA transfer family protein [Paraliobacillus ryukyuensis]
MNKHSGIVMGVKEKKVLIQPESSKLANRNYYVVGGPGSFKTQSFVLTNVINNTDTSIVVTDPKGEVYEKTAKIKEAQGYEVKVVNFKHMSLSDHYNPFGYVRKDLDATTIANTIVSAKNDPKKKDIWFNAQLGLLKSLILYAKAEFHPDKKNMEGILDFLQEFDPEANADGESELDMKFMALHKRHPARRSYELGFKKSQENTRGSIIISLLTTIGDYIDDEVADFTKNNDFFFEDIGKKKVVLYVLIPAMDKTWEGLINLFFTQMFQELYILGDKHGAKLPVPVLFLLDEFPNLGYFNDYEEFLATCRGYRIACCTILQNHTQMQDKYGDKKAESILGNCAVKICLGGVNETTATYFSNMTGKATVKVDTGGRSINKNGGSSGGSSSSSNFNYSQRVLMLPDEIQSMNKYQSLVFISGKRPIKAKKALQFELFPDLLDQYEVSQMEYQRHMSDECEKYYQKEIEQFEDGQNELNVLVSDDDDSNDIDKQDLASEEQDDAVEHAREAIEQYQNSLNTLHDIEDEDNEEESW